MPIKKPRILAGFYCGRLALHAPTLALSTAVCQKHHEQNRAQVRMVCTQIQHWGSAVCPWLTEVKCKGTDQVRGGTSMDLRGHDLFEGSKTGCCSSAATLTPGQWSESRSTSCTGMLCPLSHVPDFPKQRSCQKPSLLTPHSTCTTCTRAPAHTHTCTCWHNEK